MLARCRTTSTLESHLRVVPKFNLTSVAQLAEPPELVVRSLCLSVAVEIDFRVGPGVIGIVDIGVKVGDAAGHNVAGGRADVAILAGDGRVLPLSLSPARLVDLRT